MFKRVLSIFLTSVFSAFLFGCSPYVTWQEEVKLNDGRVIVVEQKKRIGGLMAREAWLTIKLPEFGVQPIVWHESLDPLVVNISEGKLYVVGYPPSVVEYNHYERPNPCYVGFVWENEKWNRISFEDIPIQIYKTNMLIDSFAPKGTILLTLDRKNSHDMNGDGRLPNSLRGIEPKFTCN
jgi:hypothetical protein